MTLEPRPSNQSLDTIRTILLRNDREQLRAEVDRLQARIEQLEALLAHLEAVKADEAELLPRVRQALAQITSDTVEDQPTDMAEAIGPIIAESTRVQIRESADSLSEALSPILLITIQQAIQDALRELQRRIDMRMRDAAKRLSLRERLALRSRGVDEATLALRDALPFTIEQIFLIHNESGLLLAHYSAHQDLAVSQSGDPHSDLIGAMLTAIRDFVGDAFTAGNVRPELGEVEFGEKRIIIRSGEAVYCAVVITGLEPPGFRNQMRRLLAELHLQNRNQLLAYNGDPHSIPNLQPHLAQFAEEVPTFSSDRDLIKLPRGLLFGFGCFSLFLLIGLCFFGWFTWQLFPTALAANDTPTPLPVAPLPATETATPLPTPTLIPSATQEPTATVTPTDTAEPTATPSPTTTPTATASPTATAIPPTTTTPDEAIRAFTIGNVYALEEPQIDSRQLFAIFARSEVLLLDNLGEWYLVESRIGSNIQQGWVLERWLVFPDGVPIFAEE